jgi:hypothetical protein
VVPWFKAGKVYFPLEMKTSVIMGHAMSQLRLATQSGLKGKDDFLDTISMLGYLKPWKPSEALPVTPAEIDHWEHMGAAEETSGLASYIV